MRTTSVALLAVVAVVARLQVTVPRRDLASVTAVGLLDLSANAAYAAASTLGLVSLVAVLASLYPAVTVLLARQVHHERLSRLQTFGVVAALTGVVCIGVGGV
jgi:drug/metabolite transporter (DMT)-like permease